MPGWKKPDCVYSIISPEMSAVTVAKEDTVGRIITALDVHTYTNRAPAAETAGAHMGPVVAVIALVGYIPGT